ncbi:MAG: hypothetical protein AAF726_13145 [Planctomycetota bacterium]
MLESVTAALLRRAQRDAEHARDLLVGQPLNMAKGHDLTKGRREGGDGLLEL